MAPSPFPSSDNNGREYAFYGRTNMWRKRWRTEQTRTKKHNKPTETAVKQRLLTRMVIRKQLNTLTVSITSPQFLTIWFLHRDFRHRP